MKAERAATAAAAAAAAAASGGDGGGDDNTGGGDAHYYSGWFDKGGLDALLRSDENDVRVGKDIDMTRCT
jgi:hypothetical protein